MPGPNEIRAGKAFVEVSANSTLVRDLKQAENDLNSFGNKVVAIGAGVMGAGALITAPLAAAVHTFAKMGGEMNDMSERTGVSVEKLSAFAYAAKQTGANAEIFEGGIRKMQVAIHKAEDDGGKAEQKFRELGLSIEQLQGLSPDKQFEAIAKSLASIQDPGEKAAAAVAIFGKSGTMLLPMMGELDSLTAKAQRLGLVMSGEAAQAAENFGREYETIEQQLKMVAFEIGGALVPALKGLIQDIQEAIPKVVEWVKANADLIVSIAELGTGLLVAGAAITAIGGVMNGVAAIAGALRLALAAVGVEAAAVLGPLAVAVAAAAAVVAGLYAVVAAEDSIHDESRHNREADVEKEAATRRKEWAEQEKRQKAEAQAQMEAARQKIEAVAKAEENLGKVRQAFAKATMSVEDARDAARRKLVDDLQKGILDGARSRPQGSGAGVVVNGVKLTTDEAAEYNNAGNWLKEQERQEDIASRKKVDTESGRAYESELKRRARLYVQEMGAAGKRVAEEDAEWHIKYLDYVARRQKGVGRVRGETLSEEQYMLQGRYEGKAPLGQFNTAAMGSFAFEATGGRSFTPGSGAIEKVADNTKATAENTGKMISSMREWITLFQTVYAFS